LSHSSPISCARVFTLRSMLGEQPLLPM
jgi:hypothetical protein